MYKYLNCALMLIFIVSCGLFDASEDGFSDKVRIIPSKGVDGVKFGDTVQDVVSMLGKSNYEAEVDGLDRAWISKIYKKGKYNGLAVYFIEKPGNVRYGPVDFFEMDTLYSGKTSKGIGIGSTIKEIKVAYGDPVNTKPSGSWLDYFYCFEDKTLELMTKKGIVKRMSLGFYTPLENNPAIK